MARVAYHPEAFSRQPTGKISKSVKEKAYLDWIRDLPCIVTGRLDVEAAHISYMAPHYGKLGRGKSAKESDRWAIPLCPDEHRAQHALGEHQYWSSRGIDPCIVALALHGAYPNRGLALIVIQNIVRRPSIVVKNDLLPASRNEEAD